MKKYIFILPLLVLLNSCFKEDTAVNPFPRGDITSNQVDFDVYENQIYFDLSTNSVVKTNLFGLWDLGFQAYDDYYVRINAARDIAIQDLGIVDFDTVTTALENDQYKRDLPNGNMDSSAIGKWWEVNEGSIQSKNHVYVIDRGRSHDRSRGGIWKMMILGADENGFTIKFSELKSNVIDTLYIPRIDGYNYITMSFENGGEVNNLEPLASEWDILFTKYTEFFDVLGFEIYPVNGALLNDRMCMVAEADSVIDFSDLTTEIAQMTKFSRIRNEIGWDWKQVDINTGVYTVNPSKKFLIRDPEGFIYKLRFIGFQKIIDGKAEKGYPQFEFKLL
ncbi:MAG: HmuY family protein [Candidatus Kapaibacterium sp.]